MSLSVSWNKRTQAREIVHAAEMFPDHPQKRTPSKTNATPADVYDSLIVPTELKSTALTYNSPSATSFLSLDCATQYFGSPDQSLDRSASREAPHLTTLDALVQYMYDEDTKPILAALRADEGIAQIEMFYGVLLNMAHLGLHSDSRLFRDVMLAVNNEQSLRAMVEHALWTSEVVRPCWLRVWNDVAICGMSELDRLKALLRWSTTKHQSVLSDLLATVQFEKIGQAELLHELAKHTTGHQRHATEFKVDDETMALIIKLAWERYQSHPSPIETPTKSGKSLLTRLWKR